MNPFGRAQAIAECAEKGCKYAPKGGALECERCGSRVTPCPLIFKSKACGYCGPVSDCDKMPATCRELGNFVRFPGFPMLPRAT